MNKRTSLFLALAAALAVAQFAAAPEASARGGLTVVVPDLVQSQLRIIQLRN